MAAKIKLLSAGAVKPALVLAIEQFHDANGTESSVAFATAPQLLQRLLAGEVADVVIAPPDVIAALGRAGKIDTANLVTLGRIGVGVMVRDGLPSPQIATVDLFQQALLNADSIVYNQASTGIYLESLFDKLGIAAQVKVKATRYPDFAAVLEHISKGRRHEIGLGATSVMIESAGKGIKFVGPLPAEIQNYTGYMAAAVANNEARPAAIELLRYLKSPSAKILFTKAGIE